MKIFWKTLLLLVFLINIAEAKNMSIRKMSKGDTISFVSEAMGCANIRDFKKIFNAKDNELSSVKCVGIQPTGKWTIVEGKHGSGGYGSYLKVCPESGFKIFLGKLLGQDYCFWVSSDEKVR